MSWPHGYGHLPLGVVDSTLNEAARRAAEFAGPTWITAETQTEARGRRGRPWANPAGNFAATLVLPAVLPEAAALRSFVASLALFDAFAGLTGRAEALALKWPNDVLFNGGKVAGILLEGLQAGGRLSGLAIGIGVNLAQAPGAGEVEPGALRPVSLAGETGLAVSPGDFLEALAPAYATWEAQFASHGFAPIRSAWLARAARLGETVTARLPGGEVTGVMREVDEAGQLVLSTPHGLRRIAAGDIFF
ncbi:biotin--[acetyl-CoA-carboxylase] ligase [Maritimibacter sp. HL-12]|uniref:biotin--[acetyl-CoA-carboxylase] ligase n=1 Tax=Maritimibacter sp. HL-12 TaxID=1162418 RepID=UPI000A0EFFFD|nr:biotin--[acetyl-CoA-carboxylase] ligase [Maritimibacter sp. HL-12]SMH29307.1 BirA family transcriptional regulator, biotin operon repressor / biotin-[acetyl-CoA-carboxylase] ligase [Maritimibacter sp. HL-12]